MIESDSPFGRLLFPRQLAPLSHAQGRARVRFPEPIWRRDARTDQSTARSLPSSRSDGWPLTQPHRHRGNTRKIGSNRASMDLAETSPCRHRPADVQHALSWAKSRAKTSTSAAEQAPVRLRIASCTGRSLSGIEL